MPACSSDATARRRKHLHGSLADWRKVLGTSSTPWNSPASAADSVGAVVKRTRRDWSMRIAEPSARDAGDLTSTGTSPALAETASLEDVRNAGWYSKARRPKFSIAFEPSALSSTAGCKRTAWRAPPRASNGLVSALPNSSPFLVKYTVPFTRFQPMPYVTDCASLVMPEKSFSSTREISDDNEAAAAPPLAAGASPNGVLACFVDPIQCTIAALGSHTTLRGDQVRRVFGNRDALRGLRDTSMQTIASEQPAFYVFAQSERSHVLDPSRLRSGRCIQANLHILCRGGLHRHLKVVLGQALGNRAVRASKRTQR